MARKKKSKTAIRRTVDESGAKTYIKQQIADNIARSRLRKQNKATSGYNKKVRDYLNAILRNKG